MSLAARSARSGTVSANNFDSTLWIVKERQPAERDAATHTQGALRRHVRKFGGGERDRTDDPLLAKQVLSQLSYTPGEDWWVWLDSNQRPPPYQDGALTD
jgi:hypothetical protein